MSIYTAKRKLKKTSRNHLGHLKLSICEDNSALIVTVYEARGLKRKDNAPMDSYVKLYMLPDPHKQTKVKSKRVKERDPVFDERFTFILKDENDLDKRLFISVWNRDRTARSEMIGCMSFLVSDLIGPNKEINGWYQLLDEIKGKVENIQVPGSVVRMGSMSSLSSIASAPPSVVKTYAVTLVRGLKGYGFKVTVGSPVYINEVIEGLPAHESDIQAGDLILEVEGTDVIRADGDMVANMIRKQRETLHMILQRLNATNSLNQSSNSLGVFSSASQPFLSHSHSDLVLLPSKKTPVFTSQGYQEGRRSSIGGLTQPAADISGYESDIQWLHSISSSRDKMTLSKDRLPEVPEEGISPQFAQKQTQKISQLDDNSSTAIHGRLSFSQPGLENRAISPTKHYKLNDATGRKYSATSSLGSPSEEELEGGLYNLAIQSVASSKLFPGTQLQSPPYQPRTLYSSKVYTGSMISTDSAYNTDQSSRSLNQPEDSSSFGRQYQNKSPPMDTAQQYIYPTSPPASVDRHRSSEDQVISMEWESLSKLEQKRQRAINSLMKCETEFCEELKKGITTYMMPLTQDVLSENSQRTIFMNLDRMHDLSRHFITQLKSRAVHYIDSSTPPLYIDNFADIYCNKLDLMKQIFNGYLRNSENSRKEIAVSFMNPQFKKIVQEPMAGDKIPTIYSFVEAGSEYLPKMSHLMVAISYVTPLNHEDHQYLTTIICGLMTILPPSCNDLRRNWTSEITIMEKLKSTVTFGNGIEPFDLMIPGRVLLHEGEVQIIGKKKKKAWMLLFSDILLITKRSGRLLNALEPPLSLQDLTVQDINCAEDEFQIATVDCSFSRLLKVSSLQVKGQWMVKLKERANGSIRVRRATKEIENKQKSVELKHELTQQRRTPFKTRPPTDKREKSPIQTLSSALSSTSGFPLSQPVGMLGLPSKFSTLQATKHTKSSQHLQQKSSPKSHRISFFRKRQSLDFSNVTSVYNGSLSQPVESSSPHQYKIGFKDSSTKDKTKRKTRDETTPRLNKINKAKLQQWSTSFDHLLSDPVGIQLFEEFLRKECSEENILFWRACQHFKVCPSNDLQTEAEKIYSEYISHEAPNLVNIDHTVRTEVMVKMREVTRDTFDEASHSIYMLMQRDSYSRFIKQPEFREALSR